MELRNYAAIVLRWWWLLVLCTILAAGAAYGYSSTQPRVYSATAVLLINQTQGNQAVDYNGIMMSERLAQTYAQLITQAPVLDETIRQLGLPVDSATLGKLVTVRVVRNTQLLELSAEHENPQLAQSIANTAAEVFIAQRQADQLGLTASSRAVLQEQISQLKTDIQRTSQQLDRAKAAAVPDNSRSAPTTDSAEVTRLQGLLSQQQVTYADLLRTDSEMALMESQSANAVRVAVPAAIPEIPIRPKTAQNTGLAAVVGLMLALGIVFLVEYLDDTVKTEGDVEESTALSTLAIVGRIPGLRHAQGPRLVAESGAKSSFGESFRVLRANLDFSWAGEPGKAVLVTSANPQEGKSTTLANLAVALAQDGRRVLVVDADLRRPSQHRVFGVEGERGLTNLLADRGARTGDLVQQTTLPHLLLLPCGPIPPNPSELLGSGRFGEVIGELREMADLVLVDTPPILGVVDAQVMAPRVDGAVLIAESGRVRQAALGRAAEILERTGVRRLGVVLNKAGERSAGYYYYYHRKYYYSSRPSSNGVEHDRVPTERA